MGALCPNIKHVDKTMGTTLRQMVENVRGRTMPHVSVPDYSVHYVLWLWYCINKLEYFIIFMLYVTIYYLRTNQYFLKPCCQIMWKFAASIRTCYLLMY